MKTLTFGLLIPGTILTLCFSAQDYKLAAPLPHRAVKGDVFQLHFGTTSGDPGLSRSFHSPLPVDQVVAFYKQVSGWMEEVEKRLYCSRLENVKFLKPGFLNVHAVPAKPGSYRKKHKVVLRRGGCSSDFFSHSVLWLMHWITILTRIFVISVSNT